MKCIYCGHEVDLNIKSCPACGKQYKITKELIEKAIEGNQASITELYSLTYNKTYYTVRSMIKDDDTVLDIVQDSYIKGFQSLKQLERPENFQAWMKRIAVNKTKDFLKKNKPVLFTELANDDEEVDFEDERIEHLPENLIDQKETTRLINEILNSLSDEQRLVIGMFYYEQMSIKEIANELDCSENTIKSRLNYGRKKIEVQVRELENKGTKLYSLAPIPFLLWLFKCADIQAGVQPSATIIEAIKMELVSGTASSVAKTSATKAVTKSLFSNGLKNAVTTVSKTVAGKIVIGAFAVSVAVGGVAVVSSIVSGKNDEAAITDNIVETTESASPTNSPIPTATPEPTPEPIVELNLGDYISVSYSGYTGDGAVQIEFNEEDFLEYARTLWTDEELDEKMTDLEELVSSFSFSSNTGSELSNGDVIVVNLVCDEELVNELGFTFTDISWTFNVEGLEKKTVLSPFSSDIFNVVSIPLYVSEPSQDLLEPDSPASPQEINSVYITYKGVSPHITATINSAFVDTNPLRMVKYSLDKSENLKNGDVVTISADFADGYDMSAYEIENGKTTITIEGMTSYATDWSMINSSTQTDIINHLWGIWTNKFADSIYEDVYMTVVDDNGNRYCMWGADESYYEIGDISELCTYELSGSDMKSVSYFTFPVSVNYVYYINESNYTGTNDVFSASYTSYPELYGYFAVSNLIVDESGELANYMELIENNPSADVAVVELGGLYSDYSMLVNEIEQNYKNHAATNYMY